jgi:hypothetical protein
MNAWIPAATPPKMSFLGFGWHESDIVIVFEKSGAQRMAKYTQIDEDYPPEWKSCCADAWTLKNVLFWQPQLQKPEGH